MKPNQVTWWLAGALGLSLTLLLVCLREVGVTAARTDLTYSFALFATLFATLFACGVLSAWLLIHLLTMRYARRYRELQRQPLEALRPEDVENYLPRPRFPGVESVVAESRRTITHLLEITASLGERFEQMAERYELLTNNLAASVLIEDLNGRVGFCSPYTEVLTGYTVEDFTEGGGTFLESLVVEADRPRFRRARQVSALGEEIVVRYQIKHRSGILLWVETHLVPIGDSEGEIVSLLAVSIDVTASVRYQLKIEEQNRDLNDFTYMVSHDLKAPIFTIKGMASMLREDLAEKLSAEDRESLTHIIDAADRLERLVKSVIEYSSLSTKEHAETNISLIDVMREVREDLTQQLKDNHGEITVLGELPLVRGDSLWLYQVFTNLVGNAIKYSSPARKLVINIAIKSQTSELVTIAISDNGLGIPAGKLKDIFRPYKRAHTADPHAARIEGSGIGLASVKKIVEKLGGSVAVSSTEGVGSEFTVTLRLGTACLDDAAEGAPDSTTTDARSIERERFSEAHGK